MRVALMAAGFGLLLHATAAPFQCASDPDPARAIEDSPPEALWELAERFGAAGDAEARRDTLRFLIERYPSSRFAQRARLALDEGGAAAAP